MTDAAGLVASHYPVLLDEGADGIVLLTHVGRPDEQVHELGQHEMLVIVQGPHGYISPGWYDANPAVPTWNFVTAHLHGTPQLLDPTRTCACSTRSSTTSSSAFPSRAACGPRPRTPRTPSASRRAPWACASRSRFEAKNKMSQNKPAETVDRIIAELEGDGPYASAALAAEMRRTRRSGRRAGERGGWRGAGRVADRRRRPAPGADAALDVHVEAGVVRAIAPTGTLPATSGARALDLDGRWVVPGLWDRHVHISQWAMAARRIDLADVASAADAAELVAASVRAGAAEVIGMGYATASGPTGSASTCSTRSPATCRSCSSRATCTRAG